MKIEQLIDEAKSAREQAFAPYSNFKVGAALLTSTGKVFRGCNIENASYSLTCCAERTAIFNAIVAGEREFETFVVVADTKEPVSPCGACRQVMAQFFSKNVSIFLTNLHGNTQLTTIENLLPFHFQLEPNE